MNTLERILKHQIIQFGPLDIGQFMAMALGHEDHGYYMKHDPLGGNKEEGRGDFVTAPEVSQMFGEILGAWAAYQWQQLGEPDIFVLLECGPGRGTLMADVLRATRGVPGFHEACRVHLIEMSPVLRAKQGDALQGFERVGGPIWHDRFDTLPTGLPILALANEFLDALPFRQLVFKNDAWHERIVVYEDIDGDEKNGHFMFATRPCPKAMWPDIGKTGDVDEGRIYEFSPAREAVVEDLVRRLMDAGGAALLIDYGHGASALGDTFQGMKGHDYVPVLEDIGHADLTSHVDFEPIYRICHDVLKGHSYHLQPLMEQGAFLKTMGIEARASYLQRQDNGRYVKEIVQDLNRLIAPNEMGRLFKVMDLQVAGKKVEVKK